ncbi:MAG: hypothetical protein ACI83D_000328 [Planctomycetota bacterium]|jgi:hypothetical protein
MEKGESECIIGESNKVLQEVYIDEQAVGPILRFLYPLILRYTTDH